MVYLLPKLQPQPLLTQTVWWSSIRKSPSSLFKCIPHHEIECVSLPPTQYIPSICICICVCICRSGNSCLKLIEMRRSYLATIFPLHPQFATSCVDVLRNWLRQSTSIRGSTCAHQLRISPPFYTRLCTHLWGPYRKGRRPFSARQSSFA
jgi:hypothetical protein